MSEEWRPVLDGWYEVSNMGRVRRVRGGPGTKPGLIRRPALTRCGYLCLVLSVNGVSHSRSVAALVAEAFIGPRPDGLEINHINGVKHDNRVENLEYVTPSENMLHAFRTGLQSTRGDLHPQAKLSSMLVRVIRRLPGLLNQSETARLLGLNPGTINHVHTGRNWAHVN